MLLSRAADARGVTPTPAAVPAPDPYAVLARVKAGVRARVVPPFVVYTLVRRDAFDGVPDLANSYTLRIWCRTSDRGALSRHVFDSHVTGGAAFITPAFDAPIDPGPPTADLLDVIRQTQAASPAPTGTSSAAAAVTPAASPPAPALPVIGAVSVLIERHYRVTFAGYDRADIHLRLEPRSDPDHNRLTDLYVDATTYAIHRAVAHDHLYTTSRTIPERFEIEFGETAGVPVIVKIHGQTDYSQIEPNDGSEPLHEVDYRFEQISFPSTLPDWYFDAATYGEHRAEFPS